MNASVFDPALHSANVASMPLQEVLTHADGLKATQGLAAAMAFYQQWLAGTSQPGQEVALFNLGTLQAADGQHEAALASYQSALAINPGFSPAQLNLGHQHERAGRVEEALAAWRTVFDDPATHKAPEHRLHALNNSARMLEQQRRFPEAEALMQRSLLIKPNQLDVVQHYVHVRQKQCAWPWHQTFGEVTPNRLMVGTSALAMMSVTDDPALQLLAAMRYAKDKVPPEAAVPLHTRTAPRTGRIRVAYLSGDLQMHAVGMLTAELFELHDRNQFEVWAFDWTPESDQPLRQRIKRAFDRHVPIGHLSDEDAALLIARAGIDVLVDLQALTNGARPGILGQRPAPIQVSYLGLPGTSALPGVDWIIADGYVMPPELLPYCTEKPIYLPHCYQVCDRQRPIGATPTRQDAGLPDDAFVFASFNNNFKFSEEMFDAWMHILKGVPGALLWLLADNDTAKANMQARAASHGIAPDRLHFAPRVQPPDYLARFQIIDLMLDTFPYNAGTTASDALWMGTPIVTRSGRTYISRMCGSLLTAVGLPDLITEDVQSYVRLATALGNNPARVRSYRRYLTEEGRKSRLFDVPQIVRHIEAQFVHLALGARAQQPQPSGAVPAPAPAQASARSPAAQAHAAKATKSKGKRR